MSLFKRNVALGPPLRISPWRKISMGSWKNTGDSTVYGFTVLNAEPALAHIESLRQKTGQKITITHLVGKAIAETYRRYPEMNVIVRWGKLYPRKDIDLFFQVAMDDTGEDLSGAVIRNADQKSLLQIGQELSGTSRRMRGGDDMTFKRIKGLLSHFPGMLVPWLVGITDFLLYELNLWSPLIGTPRNSFGSVMITSIGSLGLDLAFPPIPPFSRLPLLVCVGAVHEAPVVRDGQVVAGKILNISFSFDHRFIDGVGAGKMLKTFEKFFLNPENLT